MSTLAPHQLHRSRDDRVIFGVCGGLGQQYGIDPVLFRLGFALATLAGGVGVLLYLLFAIVLPPDDVTVVAGGNDLSRNLGSLRDDLSSIGGRTGTDATDGSPARGRQLGGWVLVVLGLLLLAHQFGWLAWWNWEFVWPVVLIGLGIFLLLRRSAS